MARDTRRLYSIGGSALDSEPPAAAEGESVRPGASRSAEREHTVRIGALEASDDAHRVVDIGDEGVGGLDETALVPPQPGVAPPEAGSAPPDSHRPPGRGATLRMAPGSPDEGAPQDEALDAAGPAVLRRCSSCGSRYSSPDIRFCPFDGLQLEEVPDWDPSSDPLVGQTVSSRYAVEAVIAEGSMGTVYRVRHTRLGTGFAMKVLRRDLAREVEVATRIIDEARATAAIGHPGIVAVTDFGEIDASVLPDLGELSLPYFVMELLAGRSLADLIRDEGPLAPTRVARLMHQCAGALGAAHAAGIIHRDLKPDNVRLRRSELGTETVKVVDFGVAKIMGRSRKTQAGVVFGTPHYMSPEQGRGVAIDHRTDVYALGVIMYECLTGRVPFAADTYMGVVTKHLFTRPEPLRLPPEDPTAAQIESILMQCLAKEADERFGTMGELVEALEQVLAGGVAPAAPGPDHPLQLRDQEPAGRPSRGRRLVPGRGRWHSTATGLALVAALVAVAAVAFLTLRSPSAPGVGPAEPAGGSEATGSEREHRAAASAVATAEGLAAAPDDEVAPSGGGADASAAAPAPAQPGAPLPSGPRSTATATARPSPPTPRRPGGEVVDPWAD